MKQQGKHIRVGGFVGDAKVRTSKGGYGVVITIPFTPDGKDAAQRACDRMVRTGLKEGQ